MLSPGARHSLTFSTSSSGKIVLGILKRLHGFVCSRADVLQSCGHAALAVPGYLLEVGLVLRQRQQLLAAAVRGRPMLALTQLSNYMYLTLKGSFSAVSKPNFASKYALENSRRDLQNALLCTVLVAQFFV